MNALKTGALALTLIITIPILLGFGMASETTTEDYYKEISTVNMSDLILNTETNYYGNYTGVSNNTALIQVTDSWSDYVVPDYVSVSSTYTSIPMYTSTSGTLALESATTETISITSEGTYIYINHGTTNAYYDDYIVISNDAADTPTIYYDGDDGSFSYTFDPDFYLIFVKNGDVYDAYEYDTYSGTFTFIVSSEWFSILPYLLSQNNYTIEVLEPTALPTSFTFTLDFGDNPGTVILGDAVLTGMFESLTVFGSSASLDGTFYYDIDSASVVILNPGVTSLSYTYGVASGSYADPNKGWKLPDPSQTVEDGETMSTYWTNMSTNGSVTFDLAFDDEGSVSFDVYDSKNELDRTYTVSYSSGFLSFNDGSSTIPIGAYGYARLVVGLSDGLVTIYGLEEWSALGESPTTYNEYTVEYENDLGETLVGEFSTVKITDEEQICAYRVATAKTVAGQFPSTENFTFSPISYYPDTEYFTLYFNSVGIYGDSLVIAGTTFTSSPLHKTVTMEYDEETWTVVYDDTTITTTDEPTIVFNGEWSLTLTGSFYETDTHEVTNWVPGEFAFDKDDFILCMIIASVGVFVALGLYRGTRVGVLAVVCAAAGIIAFVIA